MTKDGYSKEEVLAYREKNIKQYEEDRKIWDKYIVSFSLGAIGLSAMSENWEAKINILNYILIASWICFVLTSVFAIYSYKYSSEQSLRIAQIIKQEWEDKPMESAFKLDNSPEKKKADICNKYSHILFVVGIILFLSSKAINGII